MWSQKVLEGNFVSRENINCGFEPSDYKENGSQQFTKSICSSVVIAETSPH